jgi:hypothetical protein
VLCPAAGGECEQSDTGPDFHLYLAPVGASAPCIVVLAPMPGAARVATQSTIETRNPSPRPSPCHHPKRGRCAHSHSACARLTWPKLPPIPFTPKKFRIPNPNWWPTAKPKSSYPSPGLLKYEAATKESLTELHRKAQPSPPNTVCRPYSPLAPLSPPAYRPSAGL